MLSLGRHCLASDVHGLEEVWVRGRGGDVVVFEYILLLCDDLCCTRQLCHLRHLRVHLHDHLIQQIILSFQLVFIFSMFLLGCPLGFGLIGYLGKLLVHLEERILVAALDAALIIQQSILS